MAAGSGTVGFTVISYPGKGKEHTLSMVCCWRELPARITPCDVIMHKVYCAWSRFQDKILIYFVLAKREVLKTWILISCPRGRLMTFCFSALRVYNNRIINMLTLSSFFTFWRKGELVVEKSGCGSNHAQTQLSEILTLQYPCSFCLKNVLLL
jgi:hypothetical protein